MFTRVQSHRTGALAADKLSMTASLFTTPVGLLSVWTRWTRGEGDSTDDSVVSAGTLAALNILSGALSMLWLVLPHPGGAQELPMVCATLARIGGEIYELSRPEIGELQEARPLGGISSITMPHKHNPEGSEHLDTLARLVRAHAGLLLEGMDQQHERDGRGWKTEWVSLPEISELTVTALDLAHAVVSGLEVDALAMERNLSAGGDDLRSEQILAGLSARRGKHTAQTLMAEIVASGAVGADDLVAAVAERAGLDNAEVAAWAARPATGAAAAMVDLVLDRWRDTCGETGGQG